MGQLEIIWRVGGASVPLGLGQEIAVLFLLEHDALDLRRGESHSRSAPSQRAGTGTENSNAAGRGVAGWAAGRPFDTANVECQDSCTSS